MSNSSTQPGDSLQPNNNTNSYIVFIGSHPDRVALNYSSKKVVHRTFCHYACCFTGATIPRHINTGDVIYMARLTKKPNDYAIFGKAKAIRFQDVRDYATADEIGQRPW